MAFDFPDSPAIDDEYVSGGVTYTYTAQGVWDLGSSAVMTDYVLKAGDTMSGGIKMVGDGAVGQLWLSQGNAAGNGIIEFRAADDTRRSYLGWGTADYLQWNFEGACKGVRLSGGGIQWGNDSDVTGQHDFSKGICLYGYGSTSQFGFNITSGTLNYIVQNAGNKHNFVVGTENKLQIAALGITQPTVANDKNGYFIGDRYHGMYFYGGNSLIFTEYHDRFIWRRQTTGTTGNAGDQRMTLIGGNLDASGTVSTRAVIDRTLLADYPDLETFAEGEDTADCEIPQRGVNLGKLLLHALAKIKLLESEIAVLKGGG